MRWTSKMNTFVVALVICSLTFFAIGSDAKSVPVCASNSDVSVCLTSGEYPSACLYDAKAACEGYGYHLCSLEDLAAAYVGGFRANTWALVDVPHRDARLESCRVGWTHRYDGDECFVKEGPFSTWHIANTPRPRSHPSAFCCKIQQRCK